MKILRLVLAFVLTLVMLYIARTNSMGRPESLTGSDGSYQFEITTVPKILEETSDRISVKITGPLDSTRVWLRTTQMGTVDQNDLSTYTRVEMAPAPDLGEGMYALFVEAGKRGGRFYYYFEITDADRAPLATFLPEPGRPFLLKYIGAVPGLITGLHIFFIFATVFCISLATVQAVRVVFFGGEVRPMMRQLLWATIFAFIGMIPFGVPMNYFAFDCFWEGVPFGHDATDNKTQLLFVYLLFATLAGMRSLSGGKCGRDLWQPKILGWLGIGSMAVMLFIYLIPHSIQFTPAFTYAFCYSWIGLIALVYVIGWLRAKPKSATR